MAIRVEFYELITHEQFGKQYFPEYVGCDWYWSDSVICAPWGSMMRDQLDEMIDEYLDKGLTLLKDADGEKGFADFCVVNDRRGLFNVKCEWLRVYNGVAWNPESLFGLDQPNKFPCYYGGFYYESEKVWEQSKAVLLAFDEAFDEYERKNVAYREGKVISGDLFSLDLKLPLIPYDKFFIELGEQTNLKEIKEQAPALFKMMFDNG